MSALSRLRPHRRFAWLLWLALAIPFAQAAAARHLLSHPPADAAAAQAGKKPAVHQPACDLCLAAATLGDGVPSYGMPSLPVPAVAHERPAAASSDVRQPLPVRPYQSRAPPPALR